MLVIFAFPFRVRYGIAISWARLNIWWLEKTCKLVHEVQGFEQVKHLNAGIIFSKHQSTWETLVLQFLFNPATWVIKRELLKVPFFGWGMALTEPIALDRGAGRKAIDQLIAQGKARLEKNRWIIIFPEGTRIAAGKRGRYRIGGAALAEKTGYPVIPVAHNAGEYWPRRGFIKKPGTIQLHIGAPIDSTNKSAQQILQEAEDWIENEMARITTLSSHEHGAKDNPVGD